MLFRFSVQIVLNSLLPKLICYLINNTNKILKPQLWKTVCFIPKNYLLKVIKKVAIFFHAPVLSSYSNRDFPEMFSDKVISFYFISFLCVDVFLSVLLSLRPFLYIFLSLFLFVFMFLYSLFISFVSTILLRLSFYFSSNSLCLHSFSPFIAECLLLLLLFSFQSFLHFLFPANLCFNAIEHWSRTRQDCLPLISQKWNSLKWWIKWTKNLTNWNVTSLEAHLTSSSHLRCLKLDKNDLNSEIALQKLSYNLTTLKFIVGVQFFSREIK